jgi:hypothetical protein
MAISKFKTGGDGFAALKSVKGFDPIMSFESGTTYIQFLTPFYNQPDGTIGVIPLRLHEWIKVGTKKRKDGSSYDDVRKFISPLTLDPKGFDILLDYYNIYPPAKGVGLAVELKRSGKGADAVFTTAVDSQTYTNRDDEEVTKEVLRVQFVIMSESNFWNAVKTHEDINGVPATETIWAVSKSGSGTDTKYSVIPVAGRTVEVPEDSIPSMEDFINRLDCYDEVEPLIAQAIVNGVRVKKFMPDKDKLEKAPRRGKPGLEFLYDRDPSTFSSDENEVDDDVPFDNAVPRTASLADLRAQVAANSK